MSGAATTLDPTSCAACCSVLACEFPRADPLAPHVDLARMATCRCPSAWCRLRIGGAIGDRPSFRTTSHSRSRIEPGGSAKRNSRRPARQSLSSPLLVWRGFHEFVSDRSEYRGIQPERPMLMSHSQGGQADGCVRVASEVEETPEFG